MIQIMTTPKELLGVTRWKRKKISPAYIQEKTTHALILIQGLLLPTDLFQRPRSEPTKNLKPFGEITEESKANMVTIMASIAVKCDILD